MTPEQEAMRARILPIKEAYEKVMQEQGDCSGPWKRGERDTALCAICDESCGVWCEKAPDNLCEFSPTEVHEWVCRHCGRDGMK